MAPQLTLLGLATTIVESALNQAATVATTMRRMGTEIVCFCRGVGPSHGVSAPIAVLRHAALSATGRLIQHISRPPADRTDRCAGDDSSITEPCPAAPALRSRPRAGCAHELRARAWGRVGIDAMTASRLAREHARLEPCGEGRPSQTASDVLDLDERARLMRRIAAYYGRCYMASPDELLWAGFAAIAVNDGVRPATDLAMTVAELTRRAGYVAPILRAGLGSIASSADEGIKCAFETNYAIFADLGWVHMVFLEAGIEALRELWQQGEIDRELLRGFEEIAHGTRIGGDAGHRAIVRGNLRLFRHEQKVSVTPVFSRYREALATATSLGLIAVPNGKLAARASSLGRSPYWTDVNSSQDSYGPFSRRWRWLVSHAWEPVVALHRDRRDRGCRLFDTEVGRAIEGFPERGHPWSWHGAVSLARVTGLPGRGTARPHAARAA